MARYEEATRQANRGGERPGLEPLTAAVLTTVGVFMLLDVFAAVTLPDRDTAFWPVVIITALCSGGAATVQWWRLKAWNRRHSEALAEIERRSP